MTTFDLFCASLCRALVAILPESAHTAVLEKLCSDLANAVEQLDGDVEDHIPSIMQALSSIGRVAPEIFAEHAKTVADFVLDVRSVVTQIFVVVSRHALCYGTARPLRCSHMDELQLFLIFNQLVCLQRYVPLLGISGIVC